LKLREYADSRRFYLAKHIALLYPDIKAPEYLEEHPHMDLSSLVRPELEAQNPDANVVNLESVDVLRDFPAIDNTGMDPSQMAACKSMLTKGVAIVQGPPGTGKTFVSVNALRAMVQNHQPGDPPIIVTAQTNHALDQLLNHIMEFEPNVLRLGGRSDPSNLAIRKRTLYELRMSNPIQGTNSSLGRSRRELKARADDLHKVISPLLVENLLTVEILHKNGLITDAQRDSLSDDGWGGNGTNSDIDVCKSLPFSFKF
jgi:helicase required for RNAi-mediated heterochromatin assembly 1